MDELADAVRSGRWLRHTGKPIRNVISIDIDVDPRGGASVQPTPPCVAD